MAPGARCHLAPLGRRLLIGVRVDLALGAPGGDPRRWLRRNRILIELKTGQLRPGHRAGQGSTFSSTCCDKLFGMDYDTEAIAGVFSRAAPTYDTVIPFFAQFGARLVEVAALRTGEAVLDVGCGRGATLLPAAERVGPNGRVLGVDLSEEMLGLLTRELEERGVANASVRRMDAQALEVPDQSFDVVLSSFVVHLLPHPEAAVGELWRALRPGGRVAASAPAGAGRDWEFLMQLFRRFGPRTTRPLPIPVRPDFDLVSTLASAGFEVLRTVEEQMEFSFPDEEAWWEWAWSHGMRALFEALRPSDLEQLRRDAFTEMAELRQLHRLPMQQAALFVLALRAS